MSDQFGTTPAGPGRRVTCSQCYALWKGFRGLKLRDANFAAKARE